MQKFLLALAFVANAAFAQFPPQPIPFPQPPPQPIPFPQPPPQPIPFPQPPPQITWTLAGEYTVGNGTFQDEIAYSFPNISDMLVTKTQGCGNTMVTYQPYGERTVVGPFGRVYTETNSLLVHSERVATDPNGLAGKHYKISRNPGTWNLTKIELTKSVRSNNPGYCKYYFWVY